jgi:hypothetical protein
VWNSSPTKIGALVRRGCILLLAGIGTIIQLINVLSYGGVSVVVTRK